LSIATPQSGQEFAVTTVARSAKAFLQRWHKRTPLWVGVAIGGRVDTRTGVVDHPKLGWQEAPVGAVFSDVLELPVSVAPHVEAMAAAELLLSPADPSAGDELTRVGAPRGSSLYFYLRETAGVAVSLDG